MPISILSLNWNLAPVPLYAALCPVTGEGLLCFMLFGTGFCLLGFFYIHDGIYFHFSFGEKKIFLSVLLNVLFPFCCRCSCKNCGMPGMELTDQNQLSGENIRKNKVFISSCHSQDMESECLFPVSMAGCPLPSWEPHTSGGPWLWALQECRPTDRVWGCSASTWV